MADTNNAFTDNDFCFACGSKNPLGLHLTFYAEGDALCTLIKPKPHWQGFAGVVHGGLQSTIMDDLMSNHLFKQERAWVATGELTVRFKKPVPLDRELVFKSTIESHQGRVWNMRGVCALADEPAVPLTVATARFIDIPAPE
ncbi:PaaI family thioesterase [bacterium]|nr:PaaI family thioesterase [bacterium]